MDQGRRATQALRGAASGRGLEAFLVPRIEQGACVSLQPPVQAWPTESSSSSCARRRRGAKARRAAPSCTWRSRWRSSPRLPGVLQVAGGAACVAGQLAWCHIAEKGGSCNVELRLPGCLLRHYTWPLLLNKTTPTGPPRRLQVQARAVGSVPLHPLPASVLPAPTTCRSVCDLQFRGRSGAACVMFALLQRVVVGTASVLLGACALSSARASPTGASPADVIRTRFSTAIPCAIPCRSATTFWTGTATTRTPTITKCLMR